MQIVRAEIRGVFANLSDAFEVTSWLTDNYNCIAWAAGDSQKWWWPDPEGESFWPRGIDRKDTVEAFIDSSKTISHKNINMKFIAQFQILTATALPVAPSFSERGRACRP